MAVSVGVVPGSPPKRSGEDRGPDPDGRRGAVGRVYLADNGRGAECERDGVEDDGRVGEEKCSGSEGCGPGVGLDIGGEEERCGFNGDDERGMVACRCERESMGAADGQKCLMLLIAD